MSYVLDDNLQKELVGNCKDSAMQIDWKELIEFKEDKKKPLQALYWLRGAAWNQDDNLQRQDHGWWNGAEDEKALLARIVFVQRSELNSSRQLSREGRWKRSGCTVLFVF